MNASPSKEIPAMPRPSSRHGFTLIELSIVLVIIGLLVGGVLVGRDLIKAAEIRATVKQVEQLDAAVNTFNVKYNCLPGDCATASNFGFTDWEGTTDSAANGNGDGTITTFGNNIGIYEALNAMMHLNEAKLLNIDLTPGDSYPIVLTKLPTSDSSGNKGDWAINYNNGRAVDAISAHHNITTNAGHYYVLSNYWTSSNVSGVIMPVDAFAIDSKLDDGAPQSGRVLATSAVNGAGYDASSYPYNYIPLFDAADDAGATLCVTASPYKYNVTNTSTTSLCAMVVKASF